MIHIQAQLAKKIPGMQDFSSTQASITLTAEVSDLTQVAAEAQRLYHIAERAVDAQLAGGSATEQVAASSQHAIPPVQRQSPAQRPAASQPYRGQRREPSPISPAQARYLSQLGERSPAALADALAEYRVTMINELAAKDASKIIDRLLQAAA